MKKIVKTIFVIIYSVISFTIHIVLPQIFTYFNWTLTSPDNKWWWAGESIILVGIPFIIILLQLGFKPKIKIGDWEIEIFKKNG